MPTPYPANTSGEPIATPLSAKSNMLTRRSEFSLTAYGAPASGPGGMVGQLVDGQNRINQTNLPIPKAKYSIDSTGRMFSSSSQTHSTQPLTFHPDIYDSKKRGCILTPPTTQ